MILAAIKKVIRTSSYLKQLIFGLTELDPTEQVNLWYFLCFKAAESKLWSIL